MHVLHKQFHHPGQSSVVFLPMMDMFPGDKTSIFFTLEFICKLSFKCNVPPVVTFNQPFSGKGQR